MGDGGRFVVILESCVGRYGIVLDCWEYLERIQPEWLGNEYIQSNVALHCSVCNSKTRHSFYRLNLSAGTAPGRLTFTQSLERFPDA